jgi:hypothetical protein
MAMAMQTCDRRGDIVTTGVQAHQTKAPRTFFYGSATGVTSHTITMCDPLYLQRARTTAQKSKTPSMRPTVALAKLVNFAGDVTPMATSYADVV